MLAMSRSSYWHFGGTLRVERAIPWPSTLLRWRWTGSGFRINGNWPSASWRLTQSSLSKYFGEWPCRPRAPE